MTRCVPDKDTIIMSGQRGSSLDPSRAEDGVTSKIGMDATLTLVQTNPLRIGFVRI